ncbi:MAG: DUF4932 domain-containing protein [Treponema sp.]|nr:DUF4932 domain-containing protein [Treponema sp.]
MKKLFHTTIAALASLIMLASLFTSCSKKTKLTPVEIKPIVYQTDNITVKVDPKLELLMIALRLAEVEPFSTNYYGQEYGQFVDGVDNLFAKQKDHPFVKEIKSRAKNYKESYRSTLAITQYISDDMTQMTIKQKEMPEILTSFWKGINLKQFIAQFNDFANSSNYARIWLLYEPHLKRQAIAEQDYQSSNKKCTDWISKYFFAADSSPDYMIYSSTLTAGNYFPLPLSDQKGKTVINQIAGAYWIKDNDWNYYNSTLNITVSYIYALIEKHWDLLSAELTRLTKSIYEENQITYKVTDSIVKGTAATLVSLVCSLDFDIAKENEEIGTAFKNAITTNNFYKDPDKLIALIEVYTSNRNTYPDFESFLINYLPQALKEL